MSKSLAALTATDFEAHRDESFGIGAADPEFKLKLIKVTRLGAALREGGAFSLLFLSPAGPFLPQSVYPVTHPVLGTHDIFLVPLGPRDGGNSYEAIFA